MDNSLVSQQVTLNKCMWQVTATASVTNVELRSVVCLMSLDPTYNYHPASHRVNCITKQQCRTAFLAVNLEGLQDVCHMLRRSANLHIMLAWFK